MSDMQDDNLEALEGVGETEAENIGDDPNIGVAEDAEAQPDGETAGDEDVISFGEEEEEEPEIPAEAPGWVKKVRKSNKELSRENKRLQSELEKLKSPQKQNDDVGEKPTFESCECDDEVFERELLAWNERKRRKEQADDELRKKEEEHQKVWIQSVENYNKAKKEIKVDDYDSYELDVSNALNQTQQGIIILHAKNPAALVVALAKSPKKLQEIASIADPIKFALQMHELESKMSITRKSPPPPEQAIRASGSASGAGHEATLDRLREEAEKTNDYTKVVAYKAKMKAQTK